MPAKPPNPVVERAAKAAGQSEAKASGGVGHGADFDGESAALKEASLLYLQIKSTTFDL